jgi:zinc protease
MHCRQWLVVSLALLVSMTAEAQGRPGKGEPPRPGAGVEVRTLKNGLKVIVWPDQDIPNVSLYNFFPWAAATSAPASPACPTSSST